MSSRAAQLVQRRHELQLHCALQRQQVRHISANIESQLVVVDRVLGPLSSVTKNPVVIVAAIAGTMMLGPWRLLRWIGQGAVLFSVAKKMRHLFSK